MVWHLLLGRGLRFVIGFFQSFVEEMGELLVCRECGAALGLEPAFGLVPFVRCLFACVFGWQEVLTVLVVAAFLAVVAVIFTSVVVLASACSPSWTMAMAT